MKAAGKFLVTGGAGFIGSHLAERLLELGGEVTVLDIKKRDAVPGVRFVEGSITDEALTESLVAEHDHIFHMAAMLGVKTTMDQPAEMIENNLWGTRNVLASALRHQRKVVFASTSEVYGKGQPPFAESSDMLLGPTKKLRWSYATAKLLEEFLCLGYGRKGLPVTIVRYFNIYGPRQKEGPYGGVVPKFIRAAITGQDITVYGYGTQTRCFTFVSDAVQATVLALREEVDQQIINIGSEDEITIQELARMVKTVSGSASKIRNIPHETVYPHGFEEIPRRLPDTEKMRTLLGYTPQVGLVEGLRQTVEWYRSQESIR